jgi:hypothetical protein
MLLDVEVRVVSNVVDHLHDARPAELELRLVLARHGVAAVVSDAETLAAQAVAGRERSDLVHLADDLVIDVELE